MTREMGVLIEAFNIPIKRSDIATLCDGQWLNDEVINFYFNLLMQRQTDFPETHAKVHCFNTFFYSKLRKDGYGSIKRWTRKVDIFAVDYILIPVHLSLHWCCAAINLKGKRIEYYDSLHGDNKQCLQLLRDYLKSEYKDKKGGQLDLSEWRDHSPKNIPGQENGFDCGVFTSTFANYISLERTFDFGQRDMKYLRKRMIYEILTKKLLTMNSTKSSSL
ncbi:cysteine proteinase [Gonapodya prolifera JEL478]|uniref:Cysteine proteinase n=1 Tax=Gonapodya prolifera (strain JEL478) TaxID=1344416 RepID=A0A139ARH5_GONPJ|nr:cysteine proteinase [Gonapodya prolifera JEL478]|eukprot:KXS19360.1 cysteine proteinase [Gonapodya prolifera JEL478]